MAGTPKGFDASRVRQGLLTAMQFGLPPDTDDQPTFFMPATTTTSIDSADDEGVPFNPATRPVYTRNKVAVACAVEYQDGAGKIENFGILSRSKVKITLLDEQYEQVKGFEFCVIAGQKYFYRRTESPLGLGSIAVWIVHCEAEDEG